MTPWERWQVGFGALALLGLTSFVVLRLPGRITTEVTAFIGGDAGSDQARLSGLLREGELTRGLILTVGSARPAARAPEAALAERARETALAEGSAAGERGRAPEAALAVGSAAGEIAAVLSAREDVAWVRAGPPEGVEEAFYGLYWPRRLLLLSTDPERELPARLSDEGLADAAARLKGELRGPLGSMLKRWAAGDPFLSWVDRLRRIRASQGGGLEAIDGRLIARDAAGEWAVVFLASRASAFSTGAQAELQRAIDEAFERAAATRPGLVLERSGLARVALASQRNMQADMRRISALSLVAIVVLFLGLYRAPRLILLGFLPISAALLAAIAAGLVLFERLHALTLVFGATLLGVCIDYPVHLFNHHALDPRDERLRRLWPGLTMAALTTVTVFLGLLWTSFPGVREMAAFAAVGVTAALLITRGLVAPLLPAPAPTALLRGASEQLARGLEGLRARRWIARGLLAGAWLLLLVGLPRLEWADGPRTMYQVDPALDAEQRRVWGRVRRPDGARFVVAEAPDVEAALRLGERAAARLEAAVASGALSGYRGIGELLPSADLQARNAAALAAAPDLLPRLERALEAEGFRPGAFDELRRALSGPPAAPLELDELLASPLRDLVRPFVLLREPGRVALVTYLHGVQDGAAVEATLADLPRLGAPGGGVVYFDQDAFLARAYAHHRREVLELTAVGLGLVLALIAWRYRSPRVVLAAFLPALTAGASTLALRGLLGAPAQLLDAVALLLVLGLGLDYGIFLAEGRRDRERLPATLVSLVVACATTVLAFGLLALSSEPPLRAVGFTVGTGVLGSLLLAPLALLASGGEPAA